jgi:hypothetical protein
LLSFPRAKGPESYQPGPTAQVSGLCHFRRAEGPSHRSGMDRPYRASGIGVFDDLGRWPRLVWSAPLALEAGGTERGLSSPRLDSGLVDRNVHPPLSAGACSKRSGLLWFAGRYGARRWRLVPPEGRCEDFWGVCREIIRSCEALAPLQGALMALAGYLGHRVAQPQAIFSVPVGDARVYVRRGAA